ncbi:hypothetical protein ABH923_004022 [Leifsonia sp. EB41]|uniref:hypothetical protein n=1 Tax=Leifsonia sp. EB41 TaxID=3156260 RepID=UPI0035184E04
MWALSPRRLFVFAVSSGGVGIALFCLTEFVDPYVAGPPALRVIIEVLFAAGIRLSQLAFVLAFALAAAGTLALGLGPVLSRERALPHSPQVHGRGGRAVKLLAVGAAVSAGISLLIDGSAGPTFFGQTFAFGGDSGWLGASGTGLPEGLLEVAYYSSYVFLAACALFVCIAATIGSLTSPAPDGNDQPGPLAGSFEPREADA